MLFSTRRALLSRPPVVAAGGSGTNPGKTNLTAWYALEEATGTRNDSHTGALHLTSFSGTPGNRAGKQGNAIDVNTSKATLTSTAHQLPTTTSATWAAWVYLDNLPAAEGHPLARWTSAGDYTMVLTPAGAAAMAVARTGGNTPASTPNSTISAGAWFFLCGWYDHAASTHGTVYVQVNLGTIYSAALTAAHSPEAGATFAIGGLGSSGYGGMDGAIDEASVWIGRILSADERTWLYNGGNGRAYSELT